MSRIPINIIYYSIICQKMQDESDDNRGEGGEGGNEGEGGETFMIQNTAKRSYPLRSRGR